MNDTGKIGQNIALTSNIGYRNVLRVQNVNVQIHSTFSSDIAQHTTINPGYFISFDSLNGNIKQRTGNIDIKTFRR